MVTPSRHRVTARSAREHRPSAWPGLNTRSTLGIKLQVPHIHSNGSHRHCVHIYLLSFYQSVQHPHAVHVGQAAQSHTFPALHCGWVFIRHVTHSFTKRACTNCSHDIRNLPVSCVVLLSCLSAFHYSVAFGR